MTRDSTVTIGVFTDDKTVWSNILKNIQSEIPDVPISLIYLDPHSPNAIQEVCDIYVIQKMAINGFKCPTVVQAIRQKDSTPTIYLISNCDKCSVFCNEPALLKEIIEAGPCTYFSPDNVDISQMAETVLEMYQSKTKLNKLYDKLDHLMTTQNTLSMVCSFVT